MFLTIVSTWIVKKNGKEQYHSACIKTESNKVAIHTTGMIFVPASDTVFLDYESYFQDDA